MSKNRKISKKKKNNQLKIKYTSHTLERMKERVITKLEIEEAVKYGTFNVEGSKKFKVVFKRVNIIVKEERKNTYTVITVMNDKKYDEKVKYLSKKENLSQRKVSKILKNIESNKEIYNVAK